MICWAGPADIWKGQKSAERKAMSFLTTSFGCFCSCRPKHMISPSLPKRPVAKISTHSKMVLSGQGRAS